MNKEQKIKRKIERRLKNIKKNTKINIEFLRREIIAYQFNYENIIKWKHPSTSTIENRDIAGVKDQKYFSPEVNS
jgi:hypothetical protein